MCSPLPLTFYYRWDTLKVICDLVSRTQPARTSEIATAIDTATKTASRYLEDLSLLKLATRKKHSVADNSPVLWAASTWLRKYWPELESETEKYPPALKTTKRGDETESGTVQSQVLLSPTSESGAIHTQVGKL